MAHYIGTLQQCEDYDRQVVIGEGYGKNAGDVTTKYAETKKHPTQDKYAILAHPSYQSDMEFLEQLSENWNPEIDIIYSYEGQDNQTHKEKHSK